MTKRIAILVIIVVSVFVTATPSRAVDLPWGLHVLLIVDVVSMVGNTVYIASGSGSESWGWFGIVAGAATPPIVYAAVDDPSCIGPLVLGGVTAGVGLLGLLKAKGESRGRRDARFEFAPTIVDAGCGRYQPGVLFQTSF